MKFILRKILTLIITLFIVSLLAFLAFQVIPGSPRHQYAGHQRHPGNRGGVGGGTGVGRPRSGPLCPLGGGFCPG